MKLFVKFAIHPLPRLYPSTTHFIPIIPTLSGPSTEPKEYKKEELPEKSVKMFSDVRGCDEAKDELREVSPGLRV